MSHVFFVFLSFDSILNINWGWGGGCSAQHSCIRDQICAPCSGRWSLNHWTAQEVPGTDFSAASSGLGNEASQQRARRNQGMRRGETAHVPIA